MSIELPEARILAEQMNKELTGKHIESYHLKDHERLQNIGMMDKDTRNLDSLVDGRIESVTSRGNGILVKLNNGMNLILGPEYGGKIFYHKSMETVPSKYHLRIRFTDGSALTVRLTSMGLINAVKERDLKQSYIYKRDFNSEIISPIEDKEFILDLFSKLLTENKRALKSVLVGKSAVVVGLSNSDFQDIIYRAKLHPKRKASELDERERKNLYNAVKQVLQERIRLKGKDQFYDLYGNNGGYIPAMGPNMKQKNCSVCGASIEKLNVGGGQVYFCPNCQK